MILAHRIALGPTDKQATYFARACGVARFSYNWALAEWKRQYREGGKPSEAGLRRQLNGIKREQFPWMLEVTKVAPQQAIKNLGAAFKRFFAGQGRYPKFKKRGIHDSFRADNGSGTFEFSDRRIRLPVIGWVRLHEPLRFSGRPVSATVSRVADRWFVSVQVEIADSAVPENQGAAVGVDLGVKALATMSDGSVFEGPKALRGRLKKLKRLSRQLSRKQKGSANRRKAAQKLSRLHYRISCIRKDALHKLTTHLSRTFSVIGIEDLNVKGMMANGRLSRAVADVGMHEFRRQLAYKAPLSGSRVVVVDRWFPSSKTCSECGHVVEALPLSVREWTCPCCGVVLDRDHNAARNLARCAASSAVPVCGGEGSVLRPAPKVKPAPMKQKPNAIAA